jgi:hypothetical protein
MSDSELEYAMQCSMIKDCVNAYRVMHICMTIRNSLRETTPRGAPLMNNCRKNIVRSPPIPLYDLRFQMEQFSLSLKKKALPATDVR